MPTARRVLSLSFRLLAIALTAIFFFWHTRETTLRFALLDDSVDRLPFTMHDHPLHFYYSQITADFFARRGRFWGYDPNFMAGYAKTMIFPTGCTLPELVAVVFGRGSEKAFRWFVASATFLPPVLLGLAARQVARSWVAFQISFCIGVVWIWCGWPLRYVNWGMAPFILSNSVSLLAVSLLADWLDQPGAKALIIGGAVAALATIAHPCSPIILALMLAPAYAARAKGMNWRHHVTVWLVPAVIILLWSPWWLPAWRLRETFGSTETGFVNENIGGRLSELILAWVSSNPEFRMFREESALLIAGLGVAWGLRHVGRAKVCALFCGAAVLFSFTYFGSVLPWVWKLQPGRYTQPFYATMVVVIGAGWAQMAMQMAGSSWSTLQSRAFPLAVVCSLAGVGLVSSKTVQYVNFKQRPPFHKSLPDPVRDLVGFLKTHVDTSGRVLFEDHGDAALSGFDPFLGCKPSALLPLMAPGQYIGGPYLKTHLKSNFTQFGDLKFFGRPVQFLDRNEFERYAQLYNLRWVVSWSNPIHQLAVAHPDLFMERARFGPLRVHELNRKTNWALAGSAQVRAEPDRLEVSQAEPLEDGTLILSYHWISTLRSAVPIWPVMREDDPVPFIGAGNPPEQFVIENDP